MEMRPVKALGSRDHGPRAENVFARTRRQERMVRVVRQVGEIARDLAQHRLPPETEGRQLGLCYSVAAPALVKRALGLRIVVGEAGGLDLCDQSAIEVVEIAAGRRI